MNHTASAASCIWSQELPALLLGQLSAGRAAEVEQHLAGCPACAAQREAFSRVFFRLRAPYAEHPVRDLAPELLARLPAAEALWRRRSFWLRAAALALATLGLSAAYAWNAQRAAAFDLAATLPPSSMNHPPSLPPRPIGRRLSPARSPGWSGRRRPTATGTLRAGVRSACIRSA